MGIIFGTVITFNDAGPDPFHLNVMRDDPKRAGKKVTISFVNHAAKTVQVELKEKDVLKGKGAGKFEIEPNNTEELDLNMDCSKAGHSYHYNFKNEAPPNDEPTIIVDPNTPG